MPLRTSDINRTGYSVPTSTTSTPSLTEMYTKLAEEAKASNVEREKAVEGIFDKLIGMYGPGGSFGQSYLEQLNRQKVQAVSSAEQGDISRGLFGLRNRGQEWESTVGEPSRLRLEDLLTERLSSAMLGKASFLQSIENPYPDYSMLAQAEAAKASTPTNIRTINSTQSLFSRDNLGFGTGGSSGTSGTGMYGSMKTATAGPANDAFAYSGPNTALLGSFNPEQANIAAGNILGSTTTATQPQMSATEAMKKFGTYSEFANWAKGQGLNPGSEAEWKAVKKRVG